MVAEMSYVTELVDCYIAVWNEPDASSQYAMIAENILEEGLPRIDFEE